MSYELFFHPDALKEWRSLDGPVRDSEVAVIVIAVGRRDRNAVYRAAERR